MSPDKPRRLSWLALLLFALFLSSMSRGISNAVSLPADHAVTDIAFALLLSGDIPIIIFLLGATAIVVSRHLRNREPLVIQSVRHHVETQSPSITIRRVRIVGDSTDGKAQVLVEHGISPPSYSLYEVDPTSQTVIHRQDSTRLPPNIKLTA